MCDMEDGKNSPSYNRSNLSTAYNSDDGEEDDNDAAADNHNDQVLVSNK